MRPLDESSRRTRLGSRLRQHRRGRPLWRLLAPAALAALCLLLPASTSVASAGWQWYMVDTHVHSAISGDAYPDLPVLARNAQAVGINAVMLGDHNLASSFPVSRVTANNVPMDDALSRWYSGTYGSPSSSTHQLVSSPVHTGTSSLHLAATSSTAGETFERAKRGSNFRSGDDVITFSLYPRQLDPGSGLYISASVGGDKTVEAPTGYTNTAGTVLPGKSNVFVYYFGSPPPASFYGSGARVVATQLSTSYCDRAFQLNTWITCTVTLDHTLPAIPAAEKPLDYDAFMELKMAAVGNGGTADGYFDTYLAHATAPVAAADEFTFRTTFVHNYDTSTFKMFPGVEMGVSKHTHRFNFGITDPSQFRSYQNGIDGIHDTQLTGYPTQVDHPALPGGISSSEAISTNAYGSDLMEVRQQVMIDPWDSILEKGVPLIGTWSSENHRGLFSGSSQETEVYAPALDFDSIMHSLFEGRAYMAPSSFSPNRLIFNLDSSSAPYPARFPLYLSSAQTSYPAHLTISGGISSGSRVVWIANGATAFTDTPGTSYNQTHSIPISGSSTYVRAELRSSSGLQTAMTEPIMFVPVAGLPSGMSYRVETVSSASGPIYSNALTQGITASSWSSTNRRLSLTLTDAADALAELRVGTGSLAPTGMTVDGSTVAAAPDLATFQAATGSSWFYDSAAHLLYLKAKHVAATASIVVSFGGVNRPPTAGPVSLTATSGASTAWTPIVSDPDGDVLTCSIVNVPAHGTATVASDCSSGTYQSTAGYSGGDSFTYKATDPSNASSPAATVTVTVSPGGGGTIARVQDTSAGASTGSIQATLPVPSGTGHALVAAVALAAGSSASVSTVTDSSGGAWTRGPVGFLTGTNTRVELWYRLAAPSVTSVTVTLSAAKSAAVNVSEWSGVASTSAVDVSAGGSGASSTTVRTPSVTTVNATDLVIGAVNFPASATSTLGGGAFTSLNNFNFSTSVHGRAAYALTSSAGSYQASWTLSVASGGNGGAILALKGA